MKTKSGANENVKLYKFSFDSKDKLLEALKKLDEKYRYLTYLVDLKDFVITFTERTPKTLDQEIINILSDNVGKKIE